MNEKKYSNAKRAIRIVTFLTLIVAFFELLFAFTQYQPGMTIGDVATYVTNKHHMYLLLLILANIGLFPAAQLLYKENGISLKDEIYDKKTLGKDILYGIGGFVVSELIGDAYGWLLEFIPGIGTTELARQGRELNTGVVIMDVIALVLVSGIFKEIFFRGLAKRFGSEVLGELPALLLFNVLFAVLDWHNLGVSFIIGLVWIFAYRKTNHLITPMICHASSGLFYLIWSLIVHAS